MKRVMMVVVWAVMAMESAAVNACPPVAVQAFGVATPLVVQATPVVVQSAPVVVQTLAVPVVQPRVVVRSQRAFGFGRRASVQVFVR